MTVDRFPFSAVVGAEDVKLALLLAALDPGIGGVLLRGEKGSAKTTLARGLAALLAADAPFVDLPVGATEDRVIGSLDVAAALTGGEVRLRPGLLADAHGGVLYVDEVNLLPDHLVDSLLDVAVSGINRVEREGVAAAHPARFVLIGSMNPEEGELRPQLLDRFGLAVAVSAPADPAVRAEAVRRRLGFDASPASTVAAYAAAEAALAQRLAAAAAAGPASVADELVEAVCELCATVGAEGLRADLVICRAAAALARWEGRDVATADDVRRVAPMALSHRARRNPLDPHGMDPDRLDDALDDALGEAPGEPPSDSGPEAGPEPDFASDSDSSSSPAGGSGERVVPPGPTAAVVRLEGRPRASTAGPPPPAASGRRTVVEGRRGRLVADRQPGSGGPGSVALAATIRQAAGRHPVEQGQQLKIEAGDLREAVREERAGNLVILVVDASGSMGAERRMEATKGAVLSLLVDAYQRRDRVALITFGGDDATVVLRPTGSVEIARTRLADLPTGGRTPLAAGILAALDVASGPVSTTHRPLLVLLTDGRATAAPSGQDPLGAARAAADLVRRRGVAAVVVDVEDGPNRLGLAAELALIMGARSMTIPDLSTQTLVGVVRAAVPDERSATKPAW